MVDWSLFDEATLEDPLEHLWCDEKTKEEEKEDGRFEVVEEHFGYVKIKQKSTDYCKWVTYSKWSSNKSDLSEVFFDADWQFDPTKGKHEKG